MPLNDDGDLIRAYGFVAIYFANLEDRVNERLRQAEPLLPNVEQHSLDSILRRGFQTRVKVLTRLIDWAEAEGPDFQSRTEDLAHAREVLAACRRVATDRNEALHSPIIADLRTGDVTRYSRDHGAYSVLSGEVYDLANSIDGVAGGVIGMGFTINSVVGRPRLSSLS